MNTTPIRIEVPFEIWEDEERFARYLAWREIDCFFWEVRRTPEYVTIELFNGAEEFVAS